MPGISIIETEIRALYSNEHRENNIIFYFIPWHAHALATTTAVLHISYYYYIVFLSGLRRTRRPYPAGGCRYMCIYFYYMYRTVRRRKKYHHLSWLYTYGLLCIYIYDVRVIHVCIWAYLYVYVYIQGDIWMCHFVFLLFIHVQTCKDSKEIYVFLASPSRVEYNTESPQRTIIISFVTLKFKNIFIFSTQ